MQSVMQFIYHVVLSMCPRPYQKGDFWHYVGFWIIYLCVIGVGQSSGAPMHWCIVVLLLEMNLINAPVYKGSFLPKIYPASKIWSTTKKQK